MDRLKAIFWQRIYLKQLENNVDNLIVTFTSLTNSLELCIYASLNIYQFHVSCLCSAFFKDGLPHV